MNIGRKRGIVIDFVSFHDTYLDAFTYVTKQGSFYLTSPACVDQNNHPPKTSAAIHAKGVPELASRATPSKKQCKPKQPNNYQIMQQLQTDKKFMAFATRQARQGKDDLQMWITNHHNRRARLDVISTASTMIEAESQVQRSKMIKIAEQGASL